MDDQEYRALIYAIDEKRPPAPKAKPPETPRDVPTGIPAVSNGGSFV